MEMLGLQMWNECILGNCRERAEPVCDDWDVGIVLKMMMAINDNQGRRKSDHAHATSELDAAADQIHVTQSLVSITG